MYGNTELYIFKSSYWIDTILMISMWEGFHIKSIYTSKVQSHNKSQTGEKSYQCIGNVTRLFPYVGFLL